jgi:hypothetical protein
MHVSWKYISLTGFFLNRLVCELAIQFLIHSSLVYGRLMCTCHVLFVFNRITGVSWVKNLDNHFSQFVYADQQNMKTCGLWYMFCS